MGSLTSVVPTEHNLLGSLHEDTTANTPNAGDLIRGSAVPASWERFTVGSATQIIGVSSGLPAWSAQTYIDHGSITGLGDDDHSLYLLAADATDRTTFATNWTDLTDTGATTLHKHDHGGMDGLADDDHTQYVLRSVLTTRGDLPVRGASDWTRLGVGGANTVLTANGTDPAWSATPTLTSLTCPTLDGGTAANNDLTLQGTTHSTRTTSYVLLQPNGGNVGIGTPAPSRQFQIHNSADSIMTIISGIASASYILFGDSDSDNIGRIVYNNENNEMTFNTNGSQRMVMDSNGNVGIGTLTFGTSAGNVLGLKAGDSPTTFPADMIQMLSKDIITGSTGLWLYGELGDLYTFGDGYMSAALVRTITGAVTDGYAGGLKLDPGYTAATAQTVTRHNYIDVQDVSVAGGGPAAVTNACVFRFDAAAGTHKATIGATTKTTPGAVDGWVKINMNGAVWYVPAYVSTTA